MTPQHPAIQPSAGWPPRLLLALALLVTAIVYWQGLQGPFLLDDDSNLSIIRQWLEGQASLREVVFSTTASPFGRPLAMASLALSAYLGGYSPFAFKLGNLIVHLLCGLLVFVLVRRIAMSDARMRARRGWVATLVVALWLLHPLNVSTVLYSVQRMAQLSTLVLVFGMWAYLCLRQRMVPGMGAGKGHGIALFAAIPLITGAGFLAKENAVLLPALCLVLEIACFRHPRPRSVRALFVLVLALPLALGLAAFAMAPARLLGGYVSRDFDWQQRLLTQGRVLLDYLSAIVLPRPAQMGVYTDDFVISTGLLAPPATLLAIIALCGMTVVAWHLRKRFPVLLAGWGIFVGGHAMESSILPLEIYFEHRNYLPMIGILYGLVGLAIAAGDRLSGTGLGTRRLGMALSIGIMAALSIATFGRAHTWGNEALLVESAVAAHPDSMRAQLAVVDAAIRRNNLPRASAALQAMTQSTRQKTRAQGHLNRVNAGCALLGAADPHDLELAVRNAPQRISKDESETFQLLLRNTAKPCEGITDAALAAAAAKFADKAASQPDWFSPKAELRHTAASFYARAGEWERARPLAQLAWQPGMPAAASVVLINSQLATADIAAAERTYSEAQVRVDAADTNDMAGLKWLRGRIDHARLRGAASDAAGR